MIDFQSIYVPDSFAGPFLEADLRAFQSWLQRCEFTAIVFEEDYVSHLRSYHGGTIKNGVFKTREGTKHVALRLLNFADKSHPLAMYRVPATWSSVSDRMGTELMPFAELFAGDLLCFDFSTRPASVVVWSHELSQPEKTPVTEYVAPSFLSFLEMLGAKPNANKK